MREKKLFAYIYLYFMIKFIFVLPSLETKQKPNNNQKDEETVPVFFHCYRLLQNGFVIVCMKGTC